MIKSIVVLMCVFHFSHSYDQYGDTALMMAARKGRTEVVSVLLKAAANVNLQNKVQGHSKSN